MKIEKKVWPEYFQAILERRKNFELRLADWDVRIGNILILREWDPETESYTGRELEKIVTFIVKTKELDFWSDEDIKKHGYQVISFK